MLVEILDKHVGIRGCRFGHLIGGTLYSIVKRTYDHPQGSCVRLLVAAHGFLRAQVNDDLTGLEEEMVLLRRAGVHELVVKRATGDNIARWLEQH